MKQYVYVLGELLEGTREFGAKDIKAISGLFRKAMKMKGNYPKEAAWWDLPDAGIWTRPRSAGGLGGEISSTGLTGGGDRFGKRIKDIAPIASEFSPALTKTLAAKRGKYSDMISMSRPVSSRPKPGMKEGWGMTKPRKGYEKFLSPYPGD